MPWSEILSAFLGAAGALLVGVILYRRQVARRRAGVSRTLYNDLRSHLGTLHAEAAWPGAFLGKRSESSVSAETSSKWDELAVVFAELVPARDYKELEALYARLGYIGGYPVRSEWAENWDTPARGIVGEYREDYLPELVVATEQALRKVGRWAGYGSGEIESDISTSAPVPEPGYDALPTLADVGDLEERFRGLAPGLEEWMVKQISRDITVIVVERGFIPSDPASHERVRAALDERLRRFGLPDVAARESVWDWVMTNEF